MKRELKKVADGIRKERERRQKKGSFEHDEVVRFIDDSAVPRSAVKGGVAVVDGSDAQHQTTRVWIELAAGGVSLVTVRSSSLERVE
jgi:hypothetical protein